eukprot:CAMPEP_0170601804 /NCGR_PEP_ID=MMETSP0224-20130122/18052_1 /TAXON_ID=285029 /ORGANISM="Togula jolla, Strain CCCM 725" /LENGTH=53 /DNA_ID=CAMNT_0010926599 /DNA_START=877 /DNA_END=1038 /DNA_ORIENTATION=-
MDVTHHGDRDPDVDAIRLLYQDLASSLAEGLTLSLGKLAFVQHVLDLHVQIVI